MPKRLLIDLTKCDACENCTIDCAYFYRPRMEDHGILKLRELATFLVMCRRCEEPNCAAACKFDAIERQEDSGIMKRYNMRCVSCKCCCHACPFGIIYQETVPFYETNCDYCLRAGIEEPPCIVSCVNDALAFADVEEDPEQSLYVVSDTLAVRAPKWEKEKV
jgi:Fe-S-cluster-containing hydrogenase component 2